VSVQRQNSEPLLFELQNYRLQCVTPIKNNSKKSVKINFVSFIIFNSYRITTVPQLSFCMFYVTFDTVIIITIIIVIAVRRVLKRREILFFEIFSEISHESFMKCFIFTKNKKN